MQPTSESTMLKEAEIVLPTMAEVEKQLPTTPESDKISEDVKASADKWIEDVLSVGTRELESQHEVTSNVKSLGNDIELQLAEQSKLLQTPMSVLMKDADSNGEVAKDLLKMEDTARSIDPNGIDFSNLSGFRRFLSAIGLSTPLQSWFARYQSTESVLQSIMKGLEEGKNKLKRDNITLKEDQIRYRQTLFKLDDYVTFAKYIDAELANRVESIEDEEQKRFLTDEVLFPVRQRVQDLLTSKGIYQQAWVVSEVLIKTNEELVRGVERAMKHTMVALGIAASLAIALAHQKKVHKALQGTKELTEKMILDVADKLETQGTQILTQASEPFIQVEVMKTAFTKSLNTLESVSKYRGEALESMKNGCNELTQMTAEMEQRISSIEKGQQAREQYKILLN